MCSAILSLQLHHERAGTTSIREAAARELSLGQKSPGLHASYLSLSMTRGRSDLLTKRSEVTSGDDMNSAKVAAVIGLFGTLRGQAAEGQRSTLRFDDWV